MEGGQKEKRDKIKNEIFRQCWGDMIPKQLAMN